MGIPFVSGENQLKSSRGGQEIGVALVLPTKGSGGPARRVCRAGNWPLVIVRNMIARRQPSTSIPVAWAAVRKTSR
jgi:hypothetical protein